MNRIEIYTPTIEALDTWQILRYMGCRGETEERLHKMAKEAADELPLLPKACFLRLPLSAREPDVLDFGCFMVKSRNLYRNLEGCLEAYFMAVTIGMDSERYITRWSQISQVRALALDAAGSVAVENAAASTNAYLKTLAAGEGRFLRPRFSPGYGDFPLECQGEMIRILDAARKIGVSLTGQKMLLPVKSVTAVIGISASAVRCQGPQEKCETCEKMDCPYRA